MTTTTPTAIPLALGLLLLAGCSGGRTDPAPEVPPVIPAVTIFQLRIDQVDPGVVIVKDPLVPAAAALSVSDGTGVVLASTPMTIEGRGHSTWYYSFLEYPNRKLPYKIEFASRVDLMGMGPARKWVLLANRFDKSLMKNMLAFDLAQGLSFGFTNRYRLAELTLNGDYKGLYLVTDQIEVDETLRVKTGTVSPATDPDPGFLLEWDHKLIDGTGDPAVAGIDYFLVADIGQAFAFKGPKVKELNGVPGDAARVAIAAFMAEASAALLDCKTGTAGQDRYKALVDVTSFYDYFIVNEFTKNTDAASYSSIYVNRPKAGKLAMGPIWDQDIAFGWLESVRSPTEWYVRDHNPWLRALVRDNAEFAAGLRARWNQVKSLVRAKVLDGIDLHEVQLRTAAARNHDRWGELSAHLNIWTPEQQYPVVITSFADVVAYVRDWADLRYAWLDAQINSPALTTF